MKLRVFVIGVLLLLPLSAGAQSTGLKALDRDYEALGWEAVGRLDMKGGGFCSATLIAPDLVLSAAHCVYDRSARMRGADQITFNAGLRNGKSAASRMVAQVAAHPGFNPREPLTARNLAHDLALLRLETPIPTSEVNPFVLHGDRVAPGQVSVVSYGRGRSSLQSRQRSCGLLQRRDNVLLFDCDVTFGSSGAPVFSHLNGRGRILSVISGGAMTFQGKKISLGPHLPPLVDTLKRSLRAQSSGPSAKIKRIQVGQSNATGAKFVRSQ